MSTGLMRDIFLVIHTMKKHKDFISTGSGGGGGDPFNDFFGGGGGGFNFNFGGNRGERQEVIPELFENTDVIKLDLNTIF